MTKITRNIASKDGQWLALTQHNPNVCVAETITIDRLLTRSSRNHNIDAQKMLLTLLNIEFLLSQLPAWI